MDRSLRNARLFPGDWRSARIAPSRFVLSYQREWDRINESKLNKQSWTICSRICEAVIGIVRQESTATNY
jgi:hypothetical protein